MLRIKGGLFLWAAAACSLSCTLASMSVLAAPVEAAAAAPTQAVHRFTRVEISPDGSRVASVEGDAPLGGYYPVQRSLIIRRVVGGAAVKVILPCGDVPQCWPDSPSWTPDGKRLAFALRVPGSHARALYTVAADGSGLAKVLDFAGTLRDLRYAPDGRLAVLATANAGKEVGATEAGTAIAGDLDAPPPEQRIAVVENGALHWQSPPELYVYEYDWLPGDQGFVGTAAPGDGDNNWWTAKLYAFSGAESFRVLYAPSDVRLQLATPRVSRDGRTVAFIGGIMSDFGSTGGDVYTLSLTGGAPINATPQMRASATALRWGCNDRLMVQLLAGDKMQFAEISTARSPAAMTILSNDSDAVNVEGVGQLLACPSGAIAVDHESFTQPPEIEVGVRGHWRNITATNAQLKLAARVQSILWKSDDFDVQGWLVLPEHSTGKLPLITIVHGGPAAAEQPHFSGPGLMTRLLDSGYAVLMPNPRGSFGQGERFTLANVRDFGHGDLRDILAGIDAAAKSAPIDLDRLGITGGSYGGFMTMWAVTQTNRFKAAVAAAGLSNWLSYYGENGIDGWMIPYFGASVYEDPAVYAQSSAINFIRNVRTPTFEYVGERDIECPAPQTQEFWHALKTLNVPTSIMIYPGEGHGLRDPQHISDALDRTLNWFDRYLKGS